ncbi:hypothetical protein Tco_1420821 [Tanacetum coccineum]
MNSDIEERRHGPSDSMHNPSQPFKFLSTDTCTNDGVASLILTESNSLPHAHTQTTKTYYKHQDSRIKNAQNTKTFANSDIQYLPKMKVVFELPKYVSKQQQQQQQEWDAWVDETVIDKDEVITEDETPELITELQNVDKHVQTIFDRARMKATLNDRLSNQFKNAEENPNEPPRYLYNKDLFFLKNGNTKEKKYILSLHKIHAERFPEAGLEEKMNRWVHKEFNNFNEDARLQFNITNIHGIKECTSKINEESETIQKTISLVIGLQKLSE